MPHGVPAVVAVALARFWPRTPLSEHMYRLLMLLSRRTIYDNMR